MIWFYLFYDAANFTKLFHNFGISSILTSEVHI